MARQLTKKVSLALAILSTLVTGQETCVEVQGPNILTNPSWEDGQNGWNYAFPHTLSTAQYSDGATSL
jgi:hypothetical protein